MSTRRDTQFQRFANLLWDELMERRGGWIDVSDAGLDEEWMAEYKLLIAQRAYDLALHVLKAVPHLQVVCANKQEAEEVMPFLPDMSQWPQEEQ